MESGYTSLRRAAQIEIVEKKSRFLGLAAPAGDPAEAEAQIEAARRSYPDATHHCYAYRVGLQGLQVRMNDDGEPQGTAGRPILEVLERFGLINACVVVVRYFGGTLLGASGLTRAYRAAATAAVEAAGPACYVPCRRVTIEVGYPEWPRVQPLLLRQGVHPGDVHYSDRVTVETSIPVVDVDAVRAAVQDATGGTCRVAIGEFHYQPADMGPTPGTC